MINPNRGKFNKTFNRYELPFSIHCIKCNKHMCDSDFEMPQKLCLECSGQYNLILSKAGINKSK